MPKKVQDRRKILERVAQMLLEKESADGDELRVSLNNNAGEYEDNQLRKEAD